MKPFLGLRCHFLLTASLAFVMLAALVAFQPEPAQAQALVGGSLISANFYHTCALEPDGGIDCWGNVEAGAGADQLPAFTQVSTGRYHSCGVLEGGRAYCWGAEDMDPRFPVWNLGQTSIPAYLRFSQLDAGVQHNCGILLDSGTAYCGGGIFAGQQQPPSGVQFIHVSAGLYQSCGVTTVGTVDCWGGWVADTDGDLQWDDITDWGQVADQPKESGNPYVMAGTGWSHSCALKLDGSVHCWGTGEDGQATDNAGPFVQFDSGYWHNCGVTPDGAIDCWGGEGVHGAGQAADQPADPDNPYVEVSAGAYYSCGLRQDGTVHCWGSAQVGQGGDHIGPYGAYTLPLPPDTTLSGGPDELTNSPTADFTFSANETLPTFECSRDGEPFSACRSPVEYTVSADGDHQFQVRAIDTAGNPDPTPAIHAWTLDSTPPETTFIDIPPTSVDYGDTMTFTFASDDPEASFECKQSTWDTYRWCASPHAWWNFEPGQTYTFNVRALDQAGNVDPSDATATFECVMQAQTITFDPLPSMTYGDAPIELSASASSGMPVSFSATGACSVVGDTLFITSAGSCTVTASQGGNEGYLPAADVSQSAIIALRPISVQANALLKLYGEIDPVLTYWVTSGSLVTGDSFDGGLRRDPGEAVGTYTIRQGSLTLGANYELTVATNSFSIEPRPASVAPNPATKVYGDADPELSGVLSGFLVADGVTASYSRTAGETVTAGPYTISAKLEPESVLSNYVITYGTAQFTITPKPASAKPNPATKVYGDADPELSGVLSGFLDVDGMTASYSRTAGETVTGGPYTISAELGPVSVLSNYDIAYETGKFTISLKPASVLPNPATKVYGAVDPTLTGSLSGFLPADGVAAAYTRTPGETVAGGPYTISANLSPASVLDNYDISYGTAQFTVTPKPVSVKPNPAAKVYGDAEPALAGTLLGFLTADGVTASYSRTAGETVTGGPYTICAELSPASVLDNYDVTYGTAQFTIAPKPASAKPNPATKVYGDADPELSGVLADFLDVDGVTASYSRTAGETVLGGPYTISAELGPASVLSNYDIAYETGKFTISLKPASALPNPATKVYGAVDPTLTGSLSGFLAADGVTARYSRTAGETVLAGPYTISAELGPASVLSNYDIVHGMADFTITPRQIDNVPLSV